VISRLAASVFVIWTLGFFWFAVFLPQPADGVKTDAIVVPTGGAGRIDRGIELLREGRAKLLLVTGVDAEVKPREFAAEYKVGQQLMDCCITLGFAAIDTKGNATETAEWIEKRKIASLRLVTTDWHMRRAALELGATLPAGVTVVRDAVPSRPTFWILFLEYNKLLAAVAFRIWPY